MPPDLDRRVAPTGAVNGSVTPHAQSERPVWLSCGSDRCFAFLHTPTVASTPAMSVLICPPFGWEEESGHHAVANWARTLAGEGFPTLRLELPGTRNSTGGVDERTPERWKAATTIAAAWLRAQTGTARVTALGLGLGGVVAVDAAIDGAAIDDLILWGVPALGRAAIRELRMQARLIAARFPDDPLPDAVDAPLQSVGYAIARHAVVAFEQITLTDRALPRAGERRALLLGRDGIAFDQRLTAHLSDAGVAVTSADGLGWGDLNHDPQSSRYPAQTVAATVAWLREAVGNGAVLSGAGAAGAAGAPTTPRRDHRATIEFEYDGVELRETARWISGRDGDLFAVTTEPVRPAEEPLCALLLNSGSLSNVGPNRTSVELARHWASAFGITAVRFDFAGIGDSTGAANRYAHSSAHYGPELVAETLSIIDRHAELGLPARFVVTGLCSGAYTALHVALGDERVVGALLLNLWAFYYTDDLLNEREPGDALARLRHEGMGRLLRRDVRPEKVLGAIRSMRPSRIVAGARRSVERAQVPQVVAALNRLRDQRTETLMLFGIGEPLFTQLEREGVLARLGDWPNVSLGRIPSRDHLYRTLELQRYVREQIDVAMVRILDCSQPVPAG